MTSHCNCCSVLGATVQTNFSMLNGKNYQSLGTAISIVNGFLSPVAVLANLLILLALWKTLSLQSASNIFCRITSSRRSLRRIISATHASFYQSRRSPRLFPSFLRRVPVSHVSCLSVHSIIARNADLPVHREVHRIVLAPALLRDSHYKESHCYCHSTLGVSICNECNHLVCYRQLLYSSSSVGHRRALLYLGDLLHLHEYLENCKNTSQADTKPSADSTGSKCSEHVEIQSKDVQFPDNLKTFCFLLFSLSVFWNRKTGSRGAWLYRHCNILHFGNSRLCEQFFKPHYLLLEG